MSGEHLRVTFAADGLFDATSAENLPAIDHAVREFDHDCSRDLHAMDLFCGAGNFAREAERRGQKAMAIDIVRDKRNHDITTERGFLCILTGILRIAPRLIRVFFQFRGSLRPHHVWASLWPLCMDIELCEQEVVPDAVRRPKPEVHPRFEPTGHQHDRFAGDRTLKVGVYDATRIFKVSFKQTSSLGWSSRHRACSGFSRS